MRGLERAVERAGRWAVGMRARGPAVLLLHGLGRTSASMGLIARDLSADRPVYAPTYRSIRQEIGDHARCVARELACMPAGPIDMVTHSMGAIVLRHLLAEGPHAWRDGRWMRRVVMIAPPNQGSAIARWITDMTGGAPIPALATLARAEPAPAWTGEAEQLWVIAGTPGPGRSGYNPLLDGENDGTVTVDETHLPGLHRLVRLPGLHSFLPLQGNVRRAVRDALDDPGRYATGRELVADLGRPGPPSEIVSQPRRRVIQQRRRIHGDRS